MSIDSCRWCKRTPKTHKKRAEDGWTDPEIDVKYPFMLDHDCLAPPLGIQIHDETRQKCVNQCNEFNKKETT